MHRFLWGALAAVLLSGAATAQAQPHRVTDLAGAWIPEFRVEANLVGSYVDDEEYQEGLGNRFGVKEAGVGLRSYVDPHFRLDFIISGEEEAGEDGVESSFGIEQAKVTWLDAPGGWEFHFGKFQTSFGEYNDGDPDEHPEVTAPEMITAYWGEDDGYLDTGFNANVYVPNPWDQSQIFWLGVFNGDNPVTFHGGRERKPVYFTRYELFWELPEQTGMEFTISHLAGVNSRSTTVDDGSGSAETYTVRGETRFTGISWELDYSGGRRYLYSGWNLLLEVYWQTRDYEKNDALTAAGESAGLDTSTSESTTGYYLLGEYILGRNWSWGARLDHAPVLLVDFGDGSSSDGNEAGTAYTIYSDSDTIDAWSLILSYHPSRFSTVRGQYSNRNIGGTIVNEVWLQLQVLIGFERPDVF